MGRIVSLRVLLRQTTSHSIMVTQPFFCLRGERVVPEIVALYDSFLPIPATASNLAPRAPAHG